MTKMSTQMQMIRANGLIGTDTVHARVHEGVLFQSDFVNESVADGQAIQLLFNPGPLKSHIQFQAVSGGDARVELFEDTVVSDPGPVLLRTNRNRNVPDTPIGSSHETPVVSSLGTRIAYLYIPGGNIFLTPGSQLHSFQEWVLRPDVNYLLQITNTSGTTNALAVAFDWYEPVDESSVLF